MTAAVTPATPVAAAAAAPTVVLIVNAVCCAMSICTTSLPVSAYGKTEPAIAIAVVSSCCATEAVDGMKNILLRTAAVTVPTDKSKVVPEGAESVPKLNSVDNVMSSPLMVATKYSVY